MPDSKHRQFLIFALVAALTLIMTVYDSLPAYAKPQRYEVGDLVVIRGVEGREHVHEPAEPVVDAWVADLPRAGDTATLELRWQGGARRDLQRTDRVRCQLIARLPPEVGTDAVLALPVPDGVAYVGTVGRQLDGRPLNGPLARARLMDHVVRWAVGELMEPGAGREVAVTVEWLVAEQGLPEVVVESAWLEDGSGVLARLP